jgi:ATP-dependent Zn protease
MRLARLQSNFMRRPVMPPHNPVKTSLLSNVRKMMRKYLLVLTLSSLTTVAFAQQQRGTPEEQRACTRDVQRHCRQVIDQGDLTVLACLQENRAKISKACDLVLKNHGQ